MNFKRFFKRKQPIQKGIPRNDLLQIISQHELGLYAFSDELKKQGFVAEAEHLVLVLQGYRGPFPPDHPRDFIRNKISGLSAWLAQSDILIPHSIQTQALHLVELLKADLSDPCWGVTTITNDGIPAASKTIVEKLFGRKLRHPGKPRVSRQALFVQKSKTYFFNVRKIVESLKISGFLDEADELLVALHGEDQNSFFHGSRGILLNQNILLTNWLREHAEILKPDQRTQLQELITAIEVELDTIFKGTKED